MTSRCRWLGRLGEHVGAEASFIVFDEIGVAVQLTTSFIDSYASYENLRESYVRWI
jgi:hypothetical protein